MSGEWPINEGLRAAGLEALRDVDAVLAIMIQNGEDERPAVGAEAIAIAAIIALSMAGQRIRKWSIAPGDSLRTIESDQARQLLTNLYSLRDGFVARPGFIFCHEHNRYCGAEAHDSGKGEDR